MDSRTYWRQREAEQLKHYITQETEYQKHIELIYDYMMDQIQKEINGFYTKYASNEGITMAEAKHRVSKLDIEEYGRKAAKYVAEKNFSDQANEEMRLYNATMKINRLEMLKANIGLELVAGFDELQKYFDTILTDRTLEEFERQAGILGATVQNNEKAAHAIVNASFHNADFKDRAWMYQDMLKSELSKLLQTGLIQGRNPRQLSSHLVKLFGAEKYKAERLMRTELARVQIEAQKQSYERNGYEEYQFHALGTACGICKDLDGRHFPIKDMRIAENAPPCHPNCRCSTSAYVDREAFDKWLGEQEKSAKTVEKSAGNDTIETGARITNLFSKEAVAFAEMYYQEIRSFSTDAQKIAKNLGKQESDIKKIKAYLFENDSLFDVDTGEWRRFDPDCAIAQSWQRLMLGKNIQPHDRILIEHELLEMQIKEKNPNMSHQKAHEMAAEEYNYGKEALEYYGNLEKYRKDNK